MTASVFDSPLFAHLFDTGEAGRLFSDTAAVRAMLLVEGALAKVQGEMGVIPELSAAAIHRVRVWPEPGGVHLCAPAGRAGRRCHEPVPFHGKTGLPASGPACDLHVPAAGGKPVRIGLACASVAGFCHVRG